MNNEYYGITLSQFCNFNTINIFSDASISGKVGNQTGCYGVVVVKENDIIDKDYRLVSSTTSNNSEIKGIRHALDMAYKYKDTVKFINIFSDSLISVMGLKEYIYNWLLKDGIYYTRSNRKVVSNQNVFIEARGLLDELSRSNSIIRIFHQKGHIDNGYNNLIEAANAFKRFNNIDGKIDLNFIRYISCWNNYVDETSRSLLRRNLKNVNYFYDPLVFYPIKLFL